MNEALGDWAVLGIFKIFDVLHRGVKEIARQNSLIDR